MTRKDQVFIVDVVVIDPMQEMMVLSVIIQLTSLAMKLNTIV
jgi:hypothetical protein